MTITYQIKILNRKVLQNKAQYDLERKAAKIPALASSNLDKYEYLAGEDLGLKPSTVEQSRFEYSPLGKIFNKGLSKDDQKEGLFKKLKNIENARKNLIKNDDNEIYRPKLEFDDKDYKGDNDDQNKKNQKNNNIDTKPPIIFDYLKSLSQEENDLMDEIEDANDDIDNGELLFIGDNKENFKINVKIKF